jgi:hypothetical protein
MNDSLEDLLWFVAGVAVLVAAYATASYSDYRTEREDACRAQGMRWSQEKDKCVPRAPAVISTRKENYDATS